MALRLSTGLRYKMLGLEASVAATISGGDGDTLAFVASTPGTITQATGSFITMGFKPGHSVKIIGATTGGNDKTAKISTVAALTLTFETGTTFAAEAFDDETVLIACDGGSLKDIFRDGCLWIYSGSQPANADTLAAGTQLVKITVASGAFSHGTADNGLEFDDPVLGVISKCSEEVWSGVGIAPGTAGWFRFVANPTDDLGASTLLPRIDGSIGTSGANLNMSSTSIVALATYTIDTFTFTLPLQYGS
jgi:hypothetical protein